MTADDLQNKATRKLNEVLRALILGEDIFPLTIPIKKPKTTAPLAELRETNRLIRSQSKELLGYGYTVKWQSINSKRHGLNDFPRELSFESANDYLRYVGAEVEAKAILENAETISALGPTAKLWCASHIGVLRKRNIVVQNAIKILSYFKTNPNAALYARQLPVSVPTKFFEQERGLLEALFEEFAPWCFLQNAEALEDRLGLLTKESLIEFRSLDASVQSLPFGHAMATARELADKAAYFTAFETVIVVENHVPFLILPNSPKTLAIMGNGYAVRRLANIHWLDKKRILYWGDIDLSGFSILAQFRKNHSHVESLMMDQSTWQQFSHHLLSHEANQIIHDHEVDVLTTEERSMIEMLRKNSMQRLEQEHINFEYIKSSISLLF